MNTKVITNLFMVLLMVLGVVYFYAANSLPKTTTQIGAGYFPKLLSIVLILLCLLYVIQNFKKTNDESIHIYTRKIVVTILLMAVFIKLWGIINYFYVLALIFMMSVLSVYRPSLKMKKISIDLIVSICTIFIIYLLFGLAMNIRF